VIGAEQVGRLGAVFFPEQGKRHAFAAQLFQTGLTVCAL
jgi:hypothetical protein